MDVSMNPIEALTGFLNLPGSGNIRLDFLITFDADVFYIHCLDFGIMSWGKTIAECKEDIQEAILIYLEDLPEGQGLFNPSPPQYWQMFYELRSIVRIWTITNPSLCESTADHFLYCGHV